VEVPYDKSPKETFAILIEETARKYDNRVAVLIDEYDTPFMEFLDEPNSVSLALKILNNYYGQLKLCDKYISFVFVTGITKFLKGGLYSAFNNPVDISLKPEYGGMLGFTNIELRKYFGGLLDKLAISQDMSLNDLLEHIDNYYCGFCFDGNTFLYNPYCVLKFLEKKMFRNYWFYSRAQDKLLSFVDDSKFMIENLREVEVSRNLLEKPSFDNLKDPLVFLYQLGFLSLRPSSNNKEYVLDYSNHEVRESLAVNVLASYYGSTKETFEVCERLRKALSSGNPRALIKEFNIYLSKIPFETLVKGIIDEYFYCHTFFTLFYAIDVEPYQKNAINIVRDGFTLQFMDTFWAIKINMCYNDEDDEKIADQALDGINLKKTGENGQRLICLGITVNSGLRRIVAWKSR
jgi:hypothetical protein